MPTDAPRIKPAAWLGWTLALAYAALFFVLLRLTGISYPSIGTTTYNLVRGMLGPMIVAASVAAGVTTYLGWWPPVLHEQAVSRPRWLVAIPILLAAAAVAGIDYPQLASIGPASLLALAVGTALIGFSEELVFRGVLLVALRTSHREWAAALLSSLLFGALHAMNFFAGQSLGVTISQMVLAFSLGLILYATRRVTGTIVVPMILHALWDFGSFTFVGGLAATHVKMTASVFVITRLLLALPLLILTLVALPKLFATDNEPPTTATVEAA
jgi:membrane protease YdiL (CAAX protease family)